ncbi:TPA: putative colanic acid polymerase WcaD [Klebsiella pneumoniae]|nr:putative colanic acid polymerase WcaD [Klebsiella pneumoniae]
MKISKYIYLPLTYLLLNFKLAAVGETFPITFATFFIFFMLPCIKGIDKNKIIISISIFMFLILFNNIFGRSLDPSKYFTSLLLFIYVAIAISIVYSCSFVQINDNRSLVHSLCFVAYLVIFLSVLEVAELILFGSSHLIALFSNFLIYSNEYLINFVQYGALRSNSLYFEPAFYSLAIISLWLTLRQFKFKRKSFDTLVFIGVLSSGSFSGLMTYIILYGMELFILYSSHAGLRKKIPYIIVTLLLSVLVIYFLLPYILVRIGELGTVGTSSYYRIIGPLQIVFSALTNIDGIIQFGSLYELVSSFGIMNGAQVGKTLDNGIYVLIVHFSWIAIFTILFLIYLLFKKTLVENKIKKFTRNSPILLPLFFVPLSLMFTGAIFSPEYIFAVITPFLASKVAN